MKYIHSDLDYVATKLACGVHMMAWGDGPLRDRIAAAYEEFHPIFLPNMGLPEEFSSELRQLWARLTAVGTMAETLAAVSDHEVRALARAICDLHTGAESAVRRRERDEHYREHLLLDAMLYGERASILSPEFDVPSGEREGSG
jgi:hypothetical protein